MLYTLRLPKILLQQTGAEGLYYKLKRNGVMKLPNYLDIEENIVLRFLRLPLKEVKMPFPTSRLITKELLVRLL